MNNVNRYYFMVSFSVTFSCLQLYQCLVVLGHVHIGCTW
jgi:hypothetical protein